MMPVFYMVLAVALGYAVTVGLSLVVTFRITAASPKFVMRDHRIGRDISWSRRRCGIPRVTFRK
jgi:hypothetical protein